jgi:hypothetical protein
VRIVPLTAAAVVLASVVLAVAGTRHGGTQGSGTVFVAPPAAAGLATNGSDGDGTNCKRLAAATSAPPGGPGFGCETFQKAYALAQPGDTVYLNWSGAWVTSQRIGTSGNKSSASPCRSPTDASGCVAFTPAQGLTPSITGGLAICADYVGLERIVFNQSTFTDSGGTTVSNGAWRIGAGDNSCLPSGSPPHDILVQDVEAHGPTSITGGAYNVYVRGGSIGDSWNLPAQFGGVGNNGLTQGVHDSTIDGVTFHDFHATNTQRYHMECMHMDFAGNANTVRNSRFHGCPIYSIRVEAEGDPTKNAGRQTNHLFENDVFDGAPLNFDCHDAGCQVTGNVVRFSTFVSTSFQPTSDCGLSAGRVCTVSGNLFYGNLVGSACPSGGRAFGLGWATAYDVFAGGGGTSTICAGDSTSAYGKRAELRSPGPPAYDDRLANCGQLAASFVPADVKGGHPKTDTEGDVLPSRGLAGAGADQCDTSLMIIGRSIGDVRLGQHEADLRAQYGPPSTVKSVKLGKERVRRLLYRAHRAYLWIYMDAAGNVVGVGTTSLYYATLSGIGVGSPVAEAVSGSKLTWLQCRTAYARPFGTSTVLVIPRGGKKGSQIASVSMLRRRYAAC